MKVQPDGVIIYSYTNCGIMFFPFRGIFDTTIMPSVELDVFSQFMQSCLVFYEIVDDMRCKIIIRKLLLSFVIEIIIAV